MDAKIENKDPRVSAFDGCPKFRALLDEHGITMRSREAGFVEDAVGSNGSNPNRRRDVLRLTRDTKQHHKIQNIKITDEGKERGVTISKEKKDELLDELNMINWPVPKTVPGNFSTLRLRSFADLNRHIATIEGLPTEFLEAVVYRLPLPDPELEAGNKYTHELDQWINHRVEVIQFKLPARVPGDRNPWVSYQFYKGNDGERWEVSTPPQYPLAQIEFLKLDRWRVDHVGVVEGGGTAVKMNERVEAWHQVYGKGLNVWGKYSTEQQGRGDVLHDPDDDLKSKADWIDNHPWREFLIKTVFVGWMGGVGSVHMTDWKGLAKAVRRASDLCDLEVFILPDSDGGGRAALPSISERLSGSGLKVRHIVFPATQFRKPDGSPGWDIADDYPRNLLEEATYEDENGESFTRLRPKADTPSLENLSFSGTWLSKSIPNAQGKPTILLADEARGHWVYLSETDDFVSLDGDFIHGTTTFVNKITPLCHPGSARVIAAEIKADVYYSGNASTPCFDPTKPPGVIWNRGANRFNVARGSGIEPLAPPPGISFEAWVKPWTDYLDFVIPNEKDRREAARWFVTTYFRRPPYAFLGVSRMTGTGKTTYGMVLARLLGMHNVSFPTEHLLGEKFNSWAAFKLLATVNEIYAGHSVKIVNALKPYITDPVFDWRRMGLEAFQLDCWLTIFACSNEIAALKLDDKDRRWLVVHFNEIRWDRERFDRLHRWLDVEGLRIVAHWAQEMAKEEGFLIRPGIEAPMTDVKADIIEKNRDDDKQEAIDLARKLEALGLDDDGFRDVTETVTKHGRTYEEPVVNDGKISRTETPRPAAITFRRFRERVAEAVTRRGKRVFASGNELLGIAEDNGMIKYKPARPKVFKFEGNEEVVLLNAVALQLVTMQPEDDQATKMREFLVSTRNRLGEEI